MKKLLMKLSMLSIFVTPATILTVSCSTKIIHKDNITDEIKFKEDNVNLSVGAIKQIDISNASNLIAKGYKNLCFESSDENVATVTYSARSKSGDLNSNFSVVCNGQGIATIKLTATNIEYQKICQGEITVSSYTFDDTTISSDYDSESSPLDIKNEIKNSDTGSFVIGKIDNWNDKWAKYGITTGFVVSLETEKSSYLKSQDDTDSTLDQALNASVNSKGEIEATLNSNFSGKLPTGKAVISLYNTKAGIKKENAVTKEIFYSSYESAINLNITGLDIEFSDEELSTKKPVVRKTISSKMELQDTNEITKISSSINFSSAPFSKDSVLSVNDENEIQLDFGFNDDTVKSFAGGSFTVNITFFTGEGDDEEMYTGSFMVNYSEYKLNPYDESKNTLSTSQLVSKYTDTNKYKSWQTGTAIDSLTICSDTNKVLDKFKAKGYNVQDVIALDSDTYDSYKDKDLIPKSNGTEYTSLKSLKVADSIKSVNNKTDVYLNSLSIDDSNNITASFGAHSSSITSGQFYYLVRCYDSQGNLAVASGVFCYDGNNSTLEAGYTPVEGENNGSSISNSLLLYSSEGEKVLMGQIKIDNMSESQFAKSNFSITSTESDIVDITAELANSSKSYTDNSSTILNVYAKTKAQTDDVADKTINVTFKSDTVEKQSFNIYSGAFVGKGTEDFDTSTISENVNITVSKDAVDRAIMVNSSENNIIYESGYSYTGTLAAMVMPEYSASDSSSRIAKLNKVEFKGVLNVEAQAVILQKSDLSSADTGAYISTGEVTFDDALNFTATIYDSDIMNSVVSAYDKGLSGSFTFKGDVTLNTKKSDSESDKYISMFSGPTSGDGVSFDVEKNLSIDSSWIGSLAALFTENDSNLSDFKMTKFYIGGDLTISQSNSEGKNELCVSTLFVCTSNKNYVSGDGLIVNGKTTIKNEFWDSNPMFYADYYPNNDDSLYNGKDFKFTFNSDVYYNNSLFYSSSTGVLDTGTYIAYSIDGYPTTTYTFGTGDNQIVVNGSSLSRGIVVLHFQKTEEGYSISSR